MSAEEPTNVEEESSATFAPVHQLTDKDIVATKTFEEDEDAKFKMRAKLFRFDSENNEWKERGTGDVRILQHKETNKVRLVMRRDKTLKVCANHYITSDMRLQPNIGSDRSWVWKVAADVSEGTPTAETLAIRFANSDNANLFKTAFEEAQKTNAELATSAPPPAIPDSTPAESSTTETPAAAAPETSEPPTQDTSDSTPATGETTGEESTTEAPAASDESKPEPEPETGVETISSTEDESKTGETAADKTEEEKKEDVTATTAAV